MIYLKKFYDATAPDSGGGDTSVLEQPNTETTEIKEAPKQTLAEALATSGVRSTSDNKPEKAVVNKQESKEKAEPVEKSEKVETTTTTSEAAKANSESLPPKEEEKSEVKSPIETLPKAQPLWQEVLKSQQPNDVLKELGFDDKTVQVLQKLKGFEKIEFFSNLIDEWKNKGDLKAYLKELSTDYSKMAPEEVMRHQLREEYPKASEKELDIAFKNEIIKAYNLDSEDEEEAAEGKTYLALKADKYRDALIEKQKTRLFPDVPEAEPPIVDNSAKEAEQNFEAYKSTINKDPYSEKVFEKKQITIGKGEDKMVIPIEPDAIKNVLFDSDRWNETQFEKTSNRDGSFKYTPKVENQILTAQFALNPQKFIQDLAQHYLSQGGKKAIEPINNAKPPENVTVSNAVAEPSNLIEGMAKSGRKVSGVM